jgi:magnesium-protoporphyrin IX monomethyl ester (oxidative) cyclase
MKVLLTKPFVPLDQRTTLTLPIGLLYLGSYLRKRCPDTEVLVVDPDIHFDDPSAFLEHLHREAADVVGITVFSQVLDHVRSLVQAIRRRQSACTIVVGGSHVNAIREKSLTEIPEADLAFFGEGEKGFSALVGQLAANGRIVDPTAIPGLVRRVSGGVEATPSKYTNDLDEFDPLDFSLIQIKDYFMKGSPMGLFRRGDHVAQIITTRGCPYPCTFCASPVNMGKPIRKRSTASIVAEIKTLVDLGADEIHIMDDNFTFDARHVIGLCRAIIEQGIKIHIAMPNGVRLDKLDEEMLRWMKRAGCYHMGFGIEVGSDEALKKVRKGITMRLASEKIDLVKRCGMTTAGFFILGFPHDDSASMAETARCPRRLGLHLASFGNFTPLPGTELFQQLINSGEITADYRPSFASGVITYAPKGMSFENLSRIQSRALLGFYLNPAVILMILRRLKVRDYLFVFRRLYNIFRRPAAIAKTTAQES